MPSECRPRTQPPNGTTGFEAHEVATEQGRFVPLGYRRLCAPCVTVAELHLCMAVPPVDAIRSMDTRDAVSGVDSNDSLVSTSDGGGCSASTRQWHGLHHRAGHHCRRPRCRPEFIAKLVSLQPRQLAGQDGTAASNETPSCLLSATMAASSDPRPLPSITSDNDCGALHGGSLDDQVRWLHVAFCPMLNDALDATPATSYGAATRGKLRDLLLSSMCEWSIAAPCNDSGASCSSNHQAAGSCLSIVLRPRLMGGGCKQSSELKHHPSPSSSPLVGNPQTPSNSAIRPAAPMRPPPPPVLKAIASPHIGSSQALGTTNNGVLYTRRAVGDDDVITVHGVDDNLSEVDVHSVEMHQLGYVGLPPPPGPNDRSGGATSDREHLKRSTTRKSVSELSRASSRNTMMSFEHVVSGAASELNESAIHGHCDSVLRRLLIDRGPTGELGRGGFGVVYTAHDQVNGQAYAVKEARYGSTGGEALMGNLRSEFRTLSQLSHPNVIRVYNFLIDEEERIARIVLELAVNGSVRKLLGRSVSGLSPSAPGRLPESVARRVVFQALLGLHYLHRHGIIHRDIKPDNLLLGEDSVVQLSDFGTCKSTIHASTGTTTTVVGTVCYMSPESISGSFSMGSDIWSVGATTIELLSGLAPWSELRCMQSIHLVFQIGSARPPNHKPQYPAPQLNVSRAAIQFLDACLLYDAKQRPTAADLLTFPWFDNITSELPLSVRQYLMKHTLPPSTWRPPPATTSPLLAGVPTTRAVPRVASRGEEVPAEVEGDEDDTFESWPSDEEEEVKPNDDDEYEYEYI